MREPGEKAIQTAIIDHWRTLGLPGTLVAAIPNALAFGQPGLTKGLPDLLVIGPDVPAKVAFIELKRRGGKLSLDQKLFRDLCNEAGATWRVTYGRDEPVEILKAWGVVR